MADYKKIYHILFNSMNEALKTLQEGLQKGEDVFIVTDNMKVDEHNVVIYPDKEE